MIALMTLALGMAPEGVDPDDLDRWEALAERAMTGPEGCWDFTGDLKVTWAMHSRAALWSRSDESPMKNSGTWEGRLDNGEWTQFSYLMTDPAGDPAEFPIYPVIGVIDAKIVEAKGVIVEEEEEEDGKGFAIKVGDKKDGEEEASNEGPINLLRKAIDGWDSRTAFSNATWSDKLDAVRLIQQVPIEDKENSELVTTTTLFPGGGDKLSRMATVFPRRLSFGTWPLKVKVYDAQFHLVQQDMGEHTFPGAENMSAVGSALGFSMSYEQRIDYRTAQRCTSAD